MLKIRSKSLIIFLILISGKLAFAQEEKVWVDFIEYDSQQYGFDAFQYAEWKTKYEHFKLNNSNYYIPNKSVLKGAEDSVLLILNSNNQKRYKLTVKIADSIISHTKMRDGDTIAYQLPAMDKDYSLDLFYGENKVGRLNVFVYEEIGVPVVIIPMTLKDIDPDSLQQSLDAIYAQAGVTFSVHVSPLFNPEQSGDAILDNPSKKHDRYTNQMIDIRDQYFEHHDPAKSYYIFLVDGFVDEDIEGYMVRNKGIGFAAFSEKNLHQRIARQLGYGIGALDNTWLDDGPKKGSTLNLMDRGDGEHLTWVQWESIRFDANTISYYDDYEDVRTNNGLIAFYLWEEDGQGNIKQTYKSLFNGIHRPFKRNQYGLHLNIDNFLFLPLFTVYDFEICLLHFLALIVLVIAMIFSRRYAFRKLRNWIDGKRIFKFGIRGANFSAFVILTYYSFLLVNQGFMLFRVEEGKLGYLHFFSVEEAIDKTRSEKDYTLLSERHMGSEVLVKRGDEWYVERKKKVLYFDVLQDSEGKRRCKYLFDSDSLEVSTIDYAQLAESHYMVFNYADTAGNLAYQKVFNHLGKEITDKLSLDDPAKRILLFVNGYRPTSIGRTFEENFSDVRMNGLEYPNSTNIIYDFDRYDYWERWNKVNELFIKRINPDDTYYADGHFSVATSNHGSLFSFSTLAAQYPDRCESGKHVCQTTTASNWWLLGAPYQANTDELLPHESNQKGFEFRKVNGRIAGRNLRQMLNEIPNKSANDTLYIVAHSMGFAYAQGIIEKLKDELNLGGYYIISPENALGGEVNTAKWKEIWQYGSNHQLHKRNAPCLLDGIAPQAKVNGLTSQHRVFIPEQFYERMGFYDSHFIGHYKWILDIPENEKGYIRQR